MTKRLFVLVSVLAVGTVLGRQSRAWRIWKNWKDLIQELAPVNPGPETVALNPLVGAFKLEGSIPAGVLAKDAPEMKSAGSHSCKWIMNKTFLECDISDTSRAGETSLTWKGHVLLGWDFQDKAYRGAIVDSQGTVGLLEGKLSEHKLNLELVSKNTLFGEPFKYRLIFDMTNAAAIKFTSEVSTPDGKWVPTELKTLTRGKTGTKEKEKE